MMRVLVAVLATAHSALAALPPGPGPWTQEKMLQPVPGAARALTEDGWKTGKLCDVSKPPWSAQNGTNATAALQNAINSCGDLPGGGTGVHRRGLMCRGLHAGLW